MARTAKDIKKAMENDNSSQHRDTKKAAKWILADVRKPEYQKAIPEYAADVQSVLDHMVELVDAGCSVNVTRDKHGKPVCYVFYPDVGEPFIAATASNAPDGYLALAVAMFKDVVVLKGKPYAHSDTGSRDLYS